MSENERKKFIKTWHENIAKSKKIKRTQNEKDIFRILKKKFKL